MEIAVEEDVRTAYWCLARKEWNKARKMCDEILGDVRGCLVEDGAHLVKLLAYCEVEGVESLYLTDKDFSKNEDYRWLLKYGGENLKNEIEKQLKMNEKHKQYIKRKQEKIKTSRRKNER